MSFELPGGAPDKQARSMIGELTGLTPHHLTGQQLQFFDEHGYLVLRHWIPDALLARLQEAGNGWIRQGWQIERNPPAQNRYEAADYRFTERPGGKVMYRVDYLHNKDYPASLELLGCPQVLAVAESMSGVNFVPTYESMVFKQEGNGEPIAWHQDAIHPRNYRIYNMDIYLDPSRSGAGALRVIPGTQAKKQDFCNITEPYGWEIPASIEVEMAPGDVLLHDVMVAHGSPATVGKAMRRTVYYEFRPAEEILEDGPWDRTWIDRRLRLIPVALRSYRSAFPEADQFEWNISEEFRPQASQDDQVELKIAHLVHMNGAMCSAGDAGRKG